MPLIFLNASFSSMAGNIEMSDPPWEPPKYSWVPQRILPVYKQKKICLDIDQGKLNFFYMKCLTNEDVLFSDIIEIWFS